MVMYYENARLAWHAGILAGSAHGGSECRWHSRQPRQPHLGRKRVSHAKARVPLVLFKLKAELFVFEADAIFCFVAMFITQLKREFVCDGKMRYFKCAHI